MLVLKEIMRLVDASKEGRLNERGKATLFNGTHREIVQGVSCRLISNGFNHIAVINVPIGW